MSEYVHTFFFGIYPYICMAVFLIVSIVRYDRDPYSWKADSSQLLRRRGLRMGSNFFHVGILLLFFSHLFGLLTPEWVYIDLISPSTKQLVAVIGGGIMGAMCLFGAIILLRRRLFDPRIRETSHFSDTAILILLTAQVTLGLLTIPSSIQHLDGGSMILLAEWAQHIVTFRSGAVTFVVALPLIFKLHLALGMTIFLVFPFTRLVHIWSAPAQYLFRSGYQIVRRRNG